MARADGRTQRIVQLASLFCGLFVAACGSVTLNGTDGGPSGSGGASGSGGFTGSGGASGSGGSAGRVPDNHRAVAVACPSTRAAGICTRPVDGGVPAGSIECNTDSDCASRRNGRCNDNSRLPGCTCSYDDCVTDADCGPGNVCACPVPTVGIAAPSSAYGNVCLASNCRVDGDCGAGAYCSPSLGGCGAYGGVVGYFCHTPKDKCINNSECAAQGGGDCRFNQLLGFWDCETSACAG